MTFSPNINDERMVWGLVGLIMILVFFLCLHVIDTLLQSWEAYRWRVKNQQIYRPVGYRPERRRRLKCPECVKDGQVSRLRGGGGCMVTDARTEVHSIGTAGVICAQGAKGMNEETALEVLHELERRQINATYEYPGYLSLHPPNGPTLNVNDLAETVSIEVLDGNLEVIETIESTLPSDCTEVSRIADHLACSYTEATC